MNEKLKEETDLKEEELQKKRSEILRKSFIDTSFRNKLVNLRFFVV